MSRKSRQSNRPENAEEGFVYIVRLKERDIHKIGITLNWSRRSRELQVGDGVETVLVKKVRKPKSLENRLHKRFKSYRIPQSEWFVLTESQINAAKGMLNEAAEELISSKTKPQVPAQNATRRPQPYRYVPQPDTRTGERFQASSVNQETQLSNVQTQKNQSANNNNEAASDLDPSRMPALVFLIGYIALVVVPYYASAVLIFAGGVGGFFVGLFLIFMGYKFHCIFIPPTSSSPSARKDPPHALNHEEARELLRNAKRKR
ncbi:MAG: GIY-YIG nuclease family protein [Synechococcus sp. WH 8007]|nr:GIY-YIG nuclease family protein [Synechococcus sp. WH 8007]